MDFCTLFELSFKFGVNMSIPVLSDLPSEEFHFTIGGETSATYETSVISHLYGGTSTMSHSSIARY